VTLAVTASDALTEEGTLAYLRETPGVFPVPWEDRHGADVGLVLAHQVTSATLERIEEAAANERRRALPVVLVVDSISEPHLLCAIDRGVVGVLLRREAGFVDIVRAARSALNGESALPATMVRAVLDKLRSLSRDQTGWSDLSVREANVLRLLADGLSTAEVAGRLNYSERTIKNVLHDIVTRRGLRNRTQAVAHAIRNGVL
jgi:DNA-binding NarL/FixJ family response regulator